MWHILGYRSSGLRSRVDGRGRRHPQKTCERLEERRLRREKRVRIDRKERKSGGPPYILQHVRRRCFGQRKAIYSTISLLSADNVSLPVLIPAGLARRQTISQNEFHYSFTARCRCKSKIRSRAEAHSKHKTKIPTAV